MEDKIKEVMDSTGLTREQAIDLINSKEVEPFKPDKCILMLGDVAIGEGNITYPQDQNPGSSKGESYPASLSIEGFIYYKPKAPSYGIEEITSLIDDCSSTETLDIIISQVTSELHRYSLDHLFTIKALVAEKHTLLNVLGK